MADDKIRMPSSGGGLIRYYDEYKSKIEMPPTYVVAGITAILVLVVVLHYIKPLG
ncbi:MAG TPA: preprotein translocase subunit Sec61beta [Nanoarchaeota archaeon]|nr:preprotein translocase subunit Sec61beta [Nanoarchaeota archaeon]